MRLLRASKKLMLLGFVLSAILPIARADLNVSLSEIPTYQYFYPCSSGVVNCNHFQLNHNYYGDFGMNGVIPANWTGQGPFDFQVDMSNRLGEVVGRVYTLTGTSVAYGFNGLVMCVGGTCLDINSKPTGLNSHGLFVYTNSYGPMCAYIGLGFNEVATLGTSDGIGCGYRDALALVNFNLGGNDYRIVPEGINDDNQILGNVRIGREFIEGVFAPSPVPEPSSILLLATAAAICARLMRRRFRRGTSTAS